MSKSYITYANLNGFGFQLVAQNKECILGLGGLVGRKRCNHNLIVLDSIFVPILNVSKSVSVSSG